MEVDPGNFSLLFKPVFISTSPVCPAAVYLYNCLCGLFPSSATKTWLYFMLIFSLFLLVFSSSLREYIALFRLSPQTPPSLDFSKYFLLMHARLYHQHGFPSSDVLSLCRCFPSVSGADRGGSPPVLAATVHGAVAFSYRSRSYSRLSPPVSDGLPAWTKWRLVVSTPLIRGGRGGGAGGQRNIRREWGREGEKRGVFVGVRDCP